MTTDSHKAFIQASIKLFEAQGGRIQRIPFQYGDVVSYDMKDMQSPRVALPTSGRHQPYLDETGFTGEAA